MGLGGGGGAGRGKKFKVARGGARHFTPARVLREDGDVWNQVREKPEEDASSSGSEGSGSEDESSADEQPATATNRLPRPSGPINPKLGNTEESDDEDINKRPASKAADALNLNRGAKTHLKASELGGERELSRREKEALAKERAKAAFWKAQEEGKTDQARADLARLAIIKKQREEAAKKKAEEAASKGKPVGAKAESLNAGKGIIGKTLGSKR
ncbi:hypothetical protein PhCBS80983_g04196 [Powellomyces hirtus]|uniref:Casein kinase substrate phosphoprotein PP28 domain-containing protein n=1 Tax=Powellomyces hirtus TaxID=109895 RepID=A0A507DZN9_9FUNG|nr:hypothetical protein PhCBS80983_g04196 [Powellomyces hirtus]